MSPQDVERQDRIVIVMGPTGAGKSTFIEYATKQSGGTIGHELKSCTANIRSVKVTHPDDKLPVIYVDTPGFDDTYKSDTEILTMIAAWLVKIYKRNFNIATILYLHRITDNRMAGSSAKNLRLFVEMCGQKAMPNVIFVTTMWGEIKESTGERREAELKKDFWKDMLSDGCQVERFQDTYESAWSIVGDLSEKHGTHVQLSNEIVDRRRKLRSTSAGIALTKELERLVKDQKQAARRIQKQARNHDNQVVVQRLNEQQEEIEQKIRSTVAQLDELKVPIARKFLDLFPWRR